MDIVEFFQQNNQVLPEEDAFMIIKQFDSNQDGVLSLVE
jgi:hypothetical protein